MLISAQMERVKNVIGTELRRVRSEKELSQSDVAARAQRLGWDISRDTIAKIEGGTRWVGDFELILLAQCLEVDVCMLLPKKLNTDELVQMT